MFIFKHFFLLNFHCLTYSDSALKQFLYKSVTKVTLAGESAGSFSAFYHLTSAPSAEPLFHRIIGQSGVGTTQNTFFYLAPKHN